MEIIIIIYNKYLWVTFCYLLCLLLIFITFLSLFCSFSNQHITKCILGWLSGAERSEQTEQNLKNALSTTVELSALHSHALITTTLGRRHLQSKPHKCYQKNFEYTKQFVQNGSMNLTVEVRLYLSNTFAHWHKTSYHMLLQDHELRVCKQFCSTIYWLKGTITC